VKLEDVPDRRDGRDGLTRDAQDLVGHHRHRPRRLRGLAHRNGVPYEIERVVCSRCGLIVERTLRRAHV
jgi:hypothetical protein